MADTQHMTINAELVRYDAPVLITERVAVAAFLAGYTDPTRRSYATDLRIFAQWCHDSGFNLLGVRRPHLETFARWMEQQGRMPSTIGRRLSTLSSFYKYCQLEDILDRNPAANLRRPKINPESPDTERSVPDLDPRLSGRRGGGRLSAVRAAASSRPILGLGCRNHR